MSLRWFAKHKENIESVTAVNIMTQAETKNNYRYAYRLHIYWSAVQTLKMCLICSVVKHVLDFWAIEALRFYMICSHKNTSLSITSLIMANADRNV